MEPIAILSAARTPIGRFLGSLGAVPAKDLGITAARAALERAGVDASEIGQTIFGMGRQAGNGPNPARQISLGLGVPFEAIAHTVNMACASSLKAIALGASAIREGDARLVLAGGTESMTRVPFLLERARTGYRLGHGEIIDGMYRDGFHCPLADQLMGATAETLADRDDISRREQDEYAVRSQHRAGAAWEAGRFAAELAPVDVPGRKGQVTRFEKDEHMRPTATIEGLGKLPPVFREDGTVHAGNSSGITDGASAVVLASATEVDARGVEPLAWIEGWAEGGVDPRIMGLGPVPATRRLLDRIGGTVDDFDVIELNEAFAAQVIACVRELGFDPEKMNPNGGAIALGHPIAATGARMVATLLHEMKRRDAARGLATLCVSGGLGFSMAFHRERPKG